MISEVGPVPGWLATSLSHRPASVTIATRGVSLAVSVWDPPSGGPSARNFILIHGNGANRGWWDCIAPLLAGNARVIALDLSGHGDSEHRSEYTLDLWANEVIDVARQMVTGPVPILVGHSMGGLVAIKAAWQAPEAFGQVVTLDTPLRRFSATQLEKRRGIAARELPRFASHAEAVAAFKTVPAVRDAIQPVIDHVAAQSYREDSGQWVLKCDPKIYLRTTDISEFMRPFPAGTVCVRAEHGLIDDGMASEIRRQLLHPSRMVDVPAAGHNLLLEEPLAVGWVVDVLSGGDVR